MANDYYKKGEEEYAKQEKSANETAQKKKDEITAQVGEANALAERNTQEQIEDTTDEYLDIVRSAGIQKELDLRDIRETRANMGLSRSGLSATEQTAATLSAGNKVGNAQIARQTAIDTLNQSLIDYKNENAAWERQQHLAIDAAKDESLSKIRTDIFDAATTATSNDYQAGVKADAEKYSAYIKSQENNEKSRKDDLKTLKDSGSIDTSLFQYAYMNGLTGKQALKEAPYTYNIASDLTPLYTQIDGYVELWKKDAPEETKRNVAKSLIKKYQNSEISSTVLSHMLEYYGVDKKVLDDIE